MSNREGSTAAGDILVVDDEKNMRRTLARILDREGYRVTTAATGEEAVELCAQHRYDIVLMDVRMPGMDGVETFRQVRWHQAGVRQTASRWGNRSARPAVLFARFPTRSR